MGRYKKSFRKWHIFTVHDDPYDINLIYDIKTQNIKELSKVSSDNNFYTTGSNSQSETYISA